MSKNVDIKNSSELRSLVVTVTGHNPNTGRNNTREIKYHYGNRTERLMVPIGSNGAKDIDGLMPMETFEFVLLYVLGEIDDKEFWALGKSTRVTAAEIKKRLIHMLKRAMLTSNGLIRLKQRAKVAEVEKTVPLEPSMPRLETERPPKYGIFYKRPDDSAKTTLIVGSSFSGKSTFLVDQLKRLFKLKDKVYDRILIFTESPNSGPLKTLSHPDVRIYPLYVPKCVQLLKQINDKTANRFNFLVILDDVVSGIRNGTFMKQVLTMRNSNISTCILLQYIKLVQPAQRNSFHNIYITNVRNEDWQYILDGFIGSIIRGGWPEAKNYKELSEKLRSYFGDYKKVLHYCQTEDWVKEMIL